MNAATTSLAELCDFVGVQIDPAAGVGDVYVGLEHVTSGRFIRSSVGKAGDVQSSKYVFEPGDVLYGKLRPYLDKAVIASERGICTTELLVLRAKPGVDPKFLIGIVHAPDFVAHAISGTTGSQHPRTSWSHVSGFRLPAFSQEEMATVSRVIWTIHDFLAANEHLVVAGESLKRVIARNLFSKGLHGVAQKNLNGGRVPGNWDVIPLGSLGRIGSGTTPDRTNARYWRDGTIPWITSGRMYEREVEGSSERVTSEAMAGGRLPLLKPGAVLIAIVGQGRTLGHCAVLRVEATVSRHVGYVQPDLARMVPEYLRGFLESRYDYLRQLASGNGSTRAALTGAILRAIQVPVPPTLDEQHEIVAILEAIDRKIELHRRKAAALEGLLKATLHKVTTGQIRPADFEIPAIAGSSLAEVVS
jgi:type I restriction enzyme S subunit